MPRGERTLTGACLCGAIAFEVTEPFTTSGYCHCTHCQRRTGTSSSANARVPREGLRISRGAERLRSYQPSGGVPKWFCTECGSHLFSGNLSEDPEVAVRLGVIDGDPGIRPQFRQYVDSAAVWEDVPDDGLERYARSRFG